MFVSKQNNSRHPFPFCGPHIPALLIDCFVVFVSLSNSKNSSLPLKSFKLYLCFAFMFYWKEMVPFIFMYCRRMLSNWTCNTHFNKRFWSVRPRFEHPTFQMRVGRYNPLFVSIIICSWVQTFTKFKNIDSYIERRFHNSSE